MLENIQNQFLRSVTKLRKSTPLYMLNAELGVVPLDIHIKSHMVGFWIKLVNSPDSKLSKIMYMYNIMQSELNLGPDYKWLNFIKTILISVSKIDLFQPNIY